MHVLRDEPLGDHVAHAAGIAAGVRLVVCVHERCGRRRRDDRRALLQVRECDLDGVDGAHEVGVDAVGPGLHRGLALHGRDAGLCDDDVELAELGEARVQRGTQFGLVADVGLGRDDPLAGLLDVVLGLFEVFQGGHWVADGVVVLADVDRDDVRALFGQPDRVAATLPSAGAGDECDLAFNASHCGPFGCACWGWYRAHHMRDRDGRRRSCRLKLKESPFRL